METLIYIFKSAAILSLFYIVYFTVLRKDTFFSTNRHFLIAGIIASFLLPFLVFTNTVYADAPILSSGIVSNSVIFSETIAPTNSFIFDWREIGIFIYFIGVLYMVFRFIKQLFSLYLLLRKQPATKLNGFNYIKVSNTITPFSYFNYIVYNPVLHTKDDLQMILKHEETHALQFHSIDVMLSNLLLIVQWINPIAWLYKKSIEENLEFIADSETIIKVQSKKEYQLSMLKEFESNKLQPVLANNFYQSLIKKRIIMLQKNQSSAKKQWKLLLILPLLGFFLWSFNVEVEVKYRDYSSPKTTMDILDEIPSIDEEKNLSTSSEKKDTKKSFKQDTKKDLAFYSVKNNINSIDTKITVTVDKTTSDAELDKLKMLFKNTYDITLKFNGIKRNSKGEIIKIKVSMKSKNSNANFNQDDADGINTFSISYNDDTGSISIGNSDHENLYFNSKSGNHFVYEIHEDNHGNGKKWVSKDGKKVKSGKYEFIIHDSDDDGESREEIHIISGSGKNSNVWVTKDKDGNIIKRKGHTTVIDIDEENDGEGNVFYFNSDEDDDDDSIFIHKTDDKGFFFVGNDGKDPLVFIDGKKSSKEEMEKLDSDSIKNIEVLKGDKVMEEYGKEAKDGVILITTNKN